MFALRGRVPQQLSGPVWMSSFDPHMQLVEQTLIFAEGNTKIIISVPKRASQQEPGSPV